MSPRPPRPTSHWTVSGVACAIALIATVGCGSGMRATSSRPRAPIRTNRTAAAKPPAPDARRQRRVLRTSQTRWRLPAPVYRTVAVASGNRIFVLGGQDPAGGTITTVQQLNTATGTSRIAGRLLIATHGGAAATLGGRLLVFGGASTTVHDLVQQFDPSHHTTRIVGRLPAPRADVTAAVVGHSVVLIGGFDGTGPQRDVWVSDDGRHFRTVATLRQAVRYPAVIPDGSDVYVFGGLISGGEYDGQFSDLIQRVHLGPRPSAAIIARLPTPLAHAMGALIAGRVLLLGGSTPHGPTNAILRFEPSRRRVVHAGRLPHPLTDAAIATINDAAYLLGGISTRPLAEVTEVRLVAIR